MNPRDLEFLTVLRKVNADMGQIALRLMRDMPDSRLPPTSCATEEMTDAVTKA